MEGFGFKTTMKNLFKGSRKAGNSFFKPTKNTLAPVIGMAVGAKSKNRQIGQARSKFLISVGGGKILSLTDLHENGLILKVM